MEDTIASPQPSRSLLDALEAFRSGDFSATAVSRVSDLSRSEARVISDAWASIPEEQRAELVRRFDQVSEERIDVNFRRVLRIALRDSSPVVRQLAIAGLWEDESTDFLDILMRVIVEDPSPDVRAAAAGALERYVGRASHGDLDDEAAATLRDCLLQTARDGTQPYGLQRKAIESLGSFGGDPEVERIVAGAYDSGDHGMQCSALYAMGKSMQSSWLPTILSELGSDEAELRYEAVRAAGTLGTTDALPALLDAARDDDAEVRHAAISAIGQIGGQGAVRALERLIDEADEGDAELIEAAIDDVQALLDPLHSP